MFAYFNIFCNLYNLHYSIDISQMLSNSGLTMKNKENGCTCSFYFLFGLIKCNVFPPIGLYIPVLAVRINGKLLVSSNVKLEPNNN